jgi:DNA-binding response OmpR family regulator
MRRILVLDDDEAILITLEEALNTLNYQVKALKNANKLSHVICNFQPDLLLLDFMLTNANGGAICHQIKTNPEFSCLPVLIMSGYEDVEELSAKAGADGFIKKPFDLSELDDKIAHCMNSRKGNIFNELV